MNFETYFDGETSHAHLKLRNALLCLTLCSPQLIKYLRDPDAGDEDRKIVHSLPQMPNKGYKNLQNKMESREITFSYMTGKELAKLDSDIYADAKQDMSKIRS